MNTTAQDVIDSFHTTFQEKAIIPEGLENAWLNKAIGLYELEITDLYYNKETKSFDSELNQYKIDTLGLQMKIFYLQRELSRIMKINNIISKDISLNGQGDTKRVSIDDLKLEKSIVEDLLHKQKTHCYA